MILPRRADPAGSLAVRRQAQRLRREEVAVAATLSEKLADRRVDLELVAEAYRLEQEAAQFDRLTRAAGTLTLTDAAKVLGIAPKRLVNWMIGNDWIFREGRDRLAAHQRRLDAGLLKQRIIRLYRSDGTESLGVSVLVTAKGLIALADVITDKRAGPL
jgi:phage antirepressor YoqD-like protein